MFESSWWRRLWGLLFVVGAVGACTSKSNSDVPCPDCSVVFISIDTLRPDRMGLYGFERDTTPRIDAFFSKGTRFENALSSAPCTVPAVVQFLRSRLNFKAPAMSIAEYFEEAGYQTLRWSAIIFFAAKRAHGTVIAKASTILMCRGPSSAIGSI